MGLHECGLPEDKLPPCWADDVRMNALFAPFRLKTANPESWDMKMKFWSDMLRQWCRHKGDAVVSAADAKVAFNRRGRTPACIDIVVEEMFRSGELVPITKYQQILQTGPEGWVRWGARLAFKPAAIALTAVTSLLPARQALDNDGLPKASIESTQKFVLESALKEQATTLLQSYPLGIERVGTVDELMKRCQWRSSRDAFETALGWLVANGQAVVKGDVVKLADTDKKVSEITSSDEAIVQLVVCSNRLALDAARLQRAVAQAEGEARAASALNNKIAAKNHLRRRHRAAQRLEKCNAALENVNAMLNTLREAPTTKAIVDTYKTTSAAMKHTMKDGGIDEDAVHDTMDELKDVMEQYNEVEKALSSTTDDFDAAELEAELKELLSTPGASGGGSTDIEKDAPQPPLRTPRKSERDFIFDGEERIIAELNELGIEDASPPRSAKTAVAEGVADDWGKQEATKKSPSKSDTSKSMPWYPPTAECLKPDAWNNNFELRQDERLHPGQPLNIDYSSPPRLYNTDFQVRDHKLASRVWLYNPDDSNGNVASLAASTDYCSSESPGKSASNFQMAPGGERKKPVPWPKDSSDSVEDLERRLKNLRGLNL